MEVLKDIAEQVQLGDDAEHLYLVVRGRIDLTLPMRVRDREEVERGGRLIRR